jgi:hypothetical protein
LQFNGEGMQIQKNGFKKVFECFLGMGRQYFFVITPVISLNGEGVNAFLPLSNVGNGIL